MLLSGSAEPSFDRKTNQLCEQVFEALSLALAQCGDPRLDSAFLIDVEPAPDASRLCAVVAASDDPDAVHAALERAGPWLRAELGAAIHRKRVPELVFVIAPAR